MGTLCRGWTTATRPPKPAIGTLGYNKTTAGFEYWNGVAWVAIGGGGGTPDVWSADVDWQDFVPDPDPAFPGAVPPANEPGTGSQYGWSLNPGPQDDAVLAYVTLPSNVDGTRNPLIHLKIDDQGVGTGVNFWTIGLGIEDVVCGGPIMSGLRGVYPGMGNQNVTDVNAQTQCLTFNGTLAAQSGVWAISVRRYASMDTAPGPVTILGMTVEIPVLA